MIDCSLKTYFYYTSILKRVSSIVQVKPNNFLYRRTPICVTRAVNYKSLQVDDETMCNISVIQN